jgi:hypothetical protein
LESKLLLASCSQPFGFTRLFAIHGCEFLSIGRLSIGRLACCPKLLRAIPGTHPLGLLRSESSPPGYDLFDLFLRSGDVLVIVLINGLRCGPNAERFVLEP